MIDLSTNELIKIVMTAPNVDFAIKTLQLKGIKLTKRKRGGFNDVHFSVGSDKFYFTTDRFNGGCILVVNNAVMMDIPA